MSVAGESTVGENPARSAASSERSELPGSPTGVRNLGALLRGRTEALASSSPGGEVSPSSGTSASTFKRAATGFSMGRLGGMGSSILLEKQAMIIDFGQAFTKVGFASEARPRQCFRSPELRARTRLGPQLSGTLPKGQWIDILDRLLSKIFFHSLSVSPKDRRVVICDAMRYPTPFREALAFVLFKRLGVPSAAFASDLSLPLYLTGLSSGIVIDLGYESVRVLPTHGGVPVVSAFSSATCGMRRVLGSLQARLKAALTQSSPDDGGQWLEKEELLEDFVARACYVTVDIPAGERRKGCSLRTDKSVLLVDAGQEPLMVPPECRSEPFELLFQEEKQGHEGDDDPETASTVQGAFVSCLERCGRDVRASVIQNVVVCGGMAMLRGLLPRLALEIQAALLSHPELKASLPRLRFTPVDFPPVFAVWTGGAVLGALEGSTPYTAEEYARGKLVPDWARDGFT